MGRKPQSQESIDKNDQALIAASEKSKINAEKNKQPKFGNPQEMIQSLKTKNLPISQISKAVKDKFNLSDDEISNFI